MGVRTPRQTNCCELVYVEAKSPSSHITGVPVIQGVTWMAREVLQVPYLKTRQELITIVFLGETPLLSGRKHRLPS